MIHHHTQLMPQEIIELDKLKFETLKEVAGMNTLVAQAKGTLETLKKDKEAFIQAREKEVSERITALLSESKKLLSETQSNYQQIHEFNNTVNEVAGFLAEMHTKFQTLVEDFNEKSELRDKNLARQEKDLSEQRKMLSLQTESIERDKKHIEVEKKRIEKEKAHIESRQKAMKIALEVIRNENARN